MATRTPLHLSAIRGRATLPVWSPDPDCPSLSSVLGLSKASSYAAVRSGEAPSIRIGGRIVVPVPALLRMLGDSTDPTEGEDHRSVHTLGNLPTSPSVGTTTEATR